MKKTEKPYLCENQEVQAAIARSVAINNKHWLAPADIRQLCEDMGIDYNTVCRYSPDSVTIRDNHFVTWVCLESFLEIAERVKKHQETGKVGSMSLPYRNDTRVNGKVSTRDYER